MTRKKPLSILLILLLIMSLTMNATVMSAFADEVSTEASSDSDGASDESDGADDSGDDSTDDNTDDSTDDNTDDSTDDNTDDSTDDSTDDVNDDENDETEDAANDGGETEDADETDMDEADKENADEEQEAPAAAAKAASSQEQNAPKAAAEEEKTVDPSTLKGVYQSGDSYYLDAKVYLLYSNEIPSNIQQGFSQNAFGPSGNNAPYVTAKVNLTELFEDPNIDVEVKSSGYWYVSYQTCKGEMTDYLNLWDAVYNCIEEGQEYFEEHFKNTFVGYVLKVESNGGHIDGVLYVKPAYLVEIYVDNKLIYTVLEEEPRAYEDYVDDAFAEGFTDLAWNDNSTDGTFSSDGKNYTIGLVANKSDVNTDTMEVSFREVTAVSDEFYLATIYYVTDAIPTYNLTVNWVDEDGNALADPSVTTGLEADSEYSAEKKSFSGYTFKGLAEDSDEESGTIDGNKVVTYVYTKTTENTTTPTTPTSSSSSGGSGSSGGGSSSSSSSGSRSSSGSSGGPGTVVELVDEQTPLADAPETAETDIPDGQVPLANVPRTGDTMFLYAGVSALSGMGLCFLGLGKKNDEEE